MHHIQARFFTFNLKDFECGS